MYFLCKDFSQKAVCTFRACTVSRTIFSIHLVIGGRDQESTGFAWWAGNARLSATRLSFKIRHFIKARSFYNKTKK